MSDGMRCSSRWGSRPLPLHLPAYGVARHGGGAPTARRSCRAGSGGGRAHARARRILRDILPAGWSETVGPPAALPQAHRCNGFCGAVRREHSRDRRSEYVSVALTGSSEGCMRYDVRVLPPASGHCARDSWRYWERGEAGEALEAATSASARTVQRVAPRRVTWPGS
jgi:hypothetical protein